MASIAATYAARTRRVLNAPNGDGLADFIMGVGAEMSAAAVAYGETDAETPIHPSIDGWTADVYQFADGSIAVRMTDAGECITARGGLRTALLDWLAARNDGGAHDAPPVPETMTPAQHPDYRPADSHHAPVMTPDTACGLPAFRVRTTPNPAFTTCADCLRALDAAETETAPDAETAETAALVLTGAHANGAAGRDTRHPIERTMTDGGPNLAYSIETSDGALYTDVHILWLETDSGYDPEMIGLLGLVACGSNECRQGSRVSVLGVGAGHFAPEPILEAMEHDTPDGCLVVPMCDACYWRTDETAECDWCDEPDDETDDETDDDDC